MTQAEREKRRHESIINGDGVQVGLDSFDSDYPADERAEAMKIRQDGRNQSALPQFIGL